jgi:hypothetical protein
MGGTSGKQNAADDPQRRSLALALFGALGGAALLQACTSERDDSAPLGEVVQALNGSGTLKFADSVSALRALTGGSQTWIAALQGYNAPGDGGGGLFYWSTTAKADDGWLVLNSGSGNSAGWRRVNPGFAQADSVTALRAMNGATKGIAVLVGWSAAGDGGGGLFHWSTSSAVDNDGTIINAGGFGSNGPGWRRIFADAVNVKWFGAKGDGTTPANTAFSRALAAGQHVLVPEGTYYLSASLDITKRGVTLELLRGAVLKLGDTLYVNAPNVSIIGYAFGVTFNSDGSGNFVPNISWFGPSGLEGALKPVLRLAETDSTGHADGASLRGLTLQNSNGATYVVGVRIGKPGLGCSGLVIENVATFDMHTGLHVQSNCQQSFFTNCYHLRTNPATFSPGVGLAIGHTGTSPSITSIWARGGSIQGFTTGIQVGGGSARPSTIRISDMVVEGFPGTGAVGVWIADVFDCAVSGLHMENGLNDPPYSNRCIVVGDAGKVAENVHISGNFLSSFTKIIEGRGWDGMVIAANNIDLSGGVMGTPALAFYNAGGGLRRTSGSWLPQLKIGRGAFASEVDIDDKTGFVFAFTQNRNVDNLVLSRLFQVAEPLTVAGTPVTLFSGASVKGMVIEFEQSANPLYYARFHLTSGGQATLLDDPFNQWSTAPNTPGKFNLYSTGGNWTLQNSAGGTWLFRMSIRELGGY